jgi:hypothetical protein
VAYLFLLGVIFVGMLTPTLRMCRGKPPHGIAPLEHEEPLLVWPSACLLLLAIALGLFMPEWFDEALRLATQH